MMATSGGPRIGRAATRMLRGGPPLSVSTFPTAPAELLSKDGYVLEREDEFEAASLDERLWLPSYLPQWSSRQDAAARFHVADGRLALRIDADQPPWNRDIDGGLRVSSLQTGVFAGPKGSARGQHRFDERLWVREEQETSRLYTPQYGLFEVRARAIDDPKNLCAFWMIGFDDEPGRSAEICVFELYGKAIGAERSDVRMGLYSFGDSKISDDVSPEALAIDARDFHTYAVEWTPAYVAFYVDERLVRTCWQSPDYPMQFLLTISEFADGPQPASAPERYPKEFVVDWFHGYRRTD